VDVRADLRGLLEDYWVKLYFGGGEIGSHRAILEDAGVKHVAMSYMGLRRRVKFHKPWVIAEKFPSYVSVFLDSGVYTINDKDDITPDEIEEINEHYQDFVRTNLDRVDLVSEFDSIAMGLDWIEEQREVFWSKIPREKFMAVWHPVWGIPYLHEMASRFEVIGIPVTSLDGRNLRPVLNALAANGTRIHGIAATKIEEMQSIRWDSVASTSWISPQRFGDTIVWTGNELKRYPKKQKEVARKRHRTLFTQKGFDAEAIANDDPTEVLKLSVWSWQEFEQYVNRRHKTDNGVTPLFSNADPPRVETPEDEVDTQEETGVNRVSTPEKSKEVTAYREPTKMLPIMGLARADENDAESPAVLSIRSESSRVCDTCFLATKCPMFEKGSNCAYNIPVKIRTREQRKALHEGLIEMQTQRVMFTRFAEEMEGGYPDPNLSKEMTLLNKMLGQFAEMEREGFSVTISARGAAEQGAQSGMISRLFGNDAGKKVQELESPASADEIIISELGEEVLESE
jgi:hypothetical protein